MAIAACRSGWGTGAADPGPEPEQAHGQHPQQLGWAQTCGGGLAWECSHRRGPGQPGGAAPAVLPAAAGMRLMPSQSLHLLRSRCCCNGMLMCAECCQHNMHSSARCAIYFLHSAQPLPVHARNTACSRDMQHAKTLGQMGYSDQRWDLIRTVKFQETSSLNRLQWEVSSHSCKVMLIGHMRNAG